MRKIESCQLVVKYLSSYPEKKEIIMALFDEAHK